MSKYARKMDEVIDEMDLIVLVWRQRRDWYRYILAYVRLQNFAGHYKRTKLVYSSDVLLFVP
jgi:hypothetical protein